MRVRSSLVLVGALLLVAAALAVAAPSPHDGQEVVSMVEVESAVAVGEVDLASIAKVSKNKNKTAPVVKKNDGKKVSSKKGVASAGAGSATSGAAPTTAPPANAPAKTHHRKSKSGASLNVKSADVKTLSARQLQLQAELDAVKRALAAKKAAAPAAATAARFQQLPQKKYRPEIVTSKQPVPNSFEHQELKALHGETQPQPRTAFDQRSLDAAAAATRSISSKLQRLSNRIDPDRGTWGLRHKGNTHGKQTAINKDGLPQFRRLRHDSNADAVAAAYANVKFGGGPTAGQTPSAPITNQKLSAIDNGVVAPPVQQQGAAAPAPAPAAGKVEIIYHDSLPPANGDIHKELIKQHQSVNPPANLAIDQKTLNEAQKTLTKAVAHGESIDQYIADQKLPRVSFKASPKNCASGKCETKTEARLLALARAASRVTLEACDAPCRRAFNISDYPVVPEYYPVYTPVTDFDDKRVDETARRIILQLLKEERARRANSTAAAKKSKKSNKKWIKPIITGQESKTLEQLLIDIDKYLRARSDSFITPSYYPANVTTSFRAQSKSAAAPSTTPCVGAACESKSPLAPRERRSTCFVRLLRDVAFASLQQSPQDLEKYIATLTVLPEMKPDVSGANTDVFSDKYVDSVARKIIAEMVKDQKKNGTKPSQPAAAPPAPAHVPIMTEKEMASLNKLMKDIDAYLASKPAGGAPVLAKTAPKSATKAPPKFRAAPKAAAKPSVAKPLATKSPKKAAKPAAASSSKPGQKKGGKSNSKVVLKDIVSAAAKVEAKLKKLTVHVEDYYPQKDKAYLKRLNLNPSHTDKQVDAIARKIALEVIKAEHKKAAAAKAAAAKKAKKKDGKKQFMSYKDVRALEKVLANVDAFLKKSAKEAKENAALGLSFRASPKADSRSTRLVRMIRAVAEVVAADTNSGNAAIARLPIVAESKTPLTPAPTSDEEVDRTARKILQELLKKNTPLPAVPSDPKAPVPEFKPVITDKERQLLNALLQEVDKYLNAQNLPRFQSIHAEPKQKLPLFVQPSLNLSPDAHAEVKAVHGAVKPPAKTAIREAVLRNGRKVISAAGAQHEKIASMKRREPKLFAPKIQFSEIDAKRTRHHEPTIVQSHRRSTFKPDYDNADSFIAIRN